MKKRAVSMLQLGVGIGIVFVLLNGIHNGYHLVEFRIGEATVPPECTYAYGDEPAWEFIALEPIEHGTVLKTLSSGQDTERLPETGRLNIVKGDGPPTLDWTSRESRRYGLPLLTESFLRAASNARFIVCALLACLLCLTACTLRWKALLDAQGMMLPFWRVFVLYFIGHFFNVLMPGAVGGDLVKAYYVAKEAHHKRTEAVSTVLIDRVIGLLALIGLCAVIMVIRLPFFLKYPETKAALVFNAALLGGAVAGLCVVFRRNVFEQWKLFRRLEERTALGGIISRVYGAFHLCMNRPSVLFKTLVYSIVNHVTLIVSAFFIGQSLEVAIPFSDYVTVFPIVNAVGAIPITPGGLGTREVAAKFLLGTVGVPAVTAVPLSLLQYAALMSWSLVGGVIYFVYSQKRGRAKEIVAAEEE